jgi:hypothetical protein
MAIGRCNLIRFVAQVFFMMFNMDAYLLLYSMQVSIDQIGETYLGMLIKFCTVSR